MSEIADFVPIHFLANMYRDAGLTVNIMPGAENRAARMYRDGYNEVRGLDKHHTAQSTHTSDEASMGYLTFNAPYPVMCNVYPHRDDPYEITICAAGPTYTAGRGGPWLDIPQDRGNKHGWTWECPNNGVGEPWSEALQTTMVIGAAVEMKFFESWGRGWTGRDYRRVFSHAEWSPGRKIDPFGPSRYTNGQNRIWDMDLFRRDVQNAYNMFYSKPPPVDPTDPNPTTPPLEDTIMTPALGTKTLSPRRLRDTRVEGDIGHFTGKLTGAGYDPGHPRAAIDIILHSIRPEGNGYITSNGVTLLTLEAGTRENVMVTVPLNKDNEWEITVHNTKTAVIIERVADYRAA